MYKRQEGFISGLAHPVIGLDHAAFIVGAGFALALLPRGGWGIAALLAGALGGAALHLAGIEIPGAQAGVAVSVLLVGALVIARRGLPWRWMAAAVALAGVLHGHAYAETVFGAEPAPLAAYLAGFTAVQAAVAAGAFALHRWLQAGRDVGATSMALGALIAAIGATFLAL